MTDKPAISRRQAWYWIFGIVLYGGIILGNGDEWRSSAELHTIMESLATLLAFMVGTMALINYYSKKERLFIIIGAGFLGTGFLDGFHAIVTSTYFKPMMPSDLPSLIPWSWVASRQFLAVLMFLSWFIWWREDRSEAAVRISDRHVYVGTAIFTLVSFLFFIVVPLPRAYYPEYLLPRPEEFLPALFFLLALVGYMRKGHWRHNIFEHWLVLSLIVGFIGQAGFMSHSGTLFDYDFDAAHTLKNVSYIFVLIGLLSSMYTAFQHEENVIRELATQKLALDEHSIVSIANIQGNITYVNDMFCDISGYSREELMGKNHRILKSVEHPPEFYKDLWGAISKGKVWKGEIKNLTRDGGYYWVMATIIPFLNENGVPFQYVSIRTDITERKELDAIKDEFVSTVSHELRTPLTVILGYLPLIMDPIKMPEAGMVAMMAGKMETSGQHLLSLVNDLLDISKIESGKLELNEVEMDLGQTVIDTGDELRPVAENKGLHLDINSVPCRIVGDSRRLHQVLINLLGNAIKFTENGGISIHLSLDSARGKAIISVNDTGPGIPEEHHIAIFDRFQQVDGTSTRSAGGTGLGLAISKKLVELHGGQIELDSTVSKGSTFTVTLPLTKQREMNHG